MISFRIKRMFFRICFWIFLVFQVAFSFDLQSVQDFYLQHNKNIFVVRQKLFIEKSPEIYRDFLETLPLTVQNLEQRVDVDLLLEKTNLIVTDLTALLDRKPPVSFLYSHAKALLSKEVLPAFSASFSNSVVFSTFCDLAVHTRLFDVMDPFVGIRSLDSKVHTKIVENYVLESEQLIPRYLGEWVEQLPSTNKFLTAIKMRQWFDRGEYQRVLDQKNQFSNQNMVIRDPFGTDVFLLIARSDLVEGYLDQAWNALLKVRAVSSKDDLAFEKTRVSLGMNKLKQARSWIPKIKDASVRSYVETLSYLKEGDTNALLLLENSINFLVRGFAYLPESLILLRVARDSPKQLKQTADLLIRLLNQQSISGASGGLALLSQNDIEENKLKGRLLEFERLIRAKNFYQARSDKDARKYLLKLIKEANSPLVKELSLSALQKL